MSSVAKRPDLSFLILHGWQNHQPVGHWQYHLAGDLAASGYQVEYPQLPKPDHPELADWSAEIVELSARLETPERVIVCHSLGCLAWLHAATRLGAPRGSADEAARQSADAARYRVVLVAPPGRTFLRATSELAEFAPESWPAPAGRAGLRGRADAPVVETLLVRSDGDPYCPSPDDLALPPIAGLRTCFVPGQGHFDMDAGYGRWPAMLDWCVRPGAAIGPRPQAEHRDAGADAPLQVATTTAW